MKHIKLVVLIVALIFTFTAGAMAEIPKMTLKWANFLPESFYYSKVDTFFAKRIKERPDGKVQIRASEKINYPVSGSGVIVMNHFSKFCNLRSLFSIGVICFFVSRTFFGYTFRTSFTVAGTTLR